MEDSPDKKLLDDIFKTWDRFAQPGRENLTVPELAKRMEKYRTQHLGKPRAVPHVFADDVN